MYGENDNIKGVIELKKKLSDDECYYEDFKRDLQFYFNSGSNHGAWTDADELEFNYLDRNVDLQDDEYYRFCVVLPLIKLQIETLGLTKQMLRELELYYDDFNNGVLDDKLYEHEYEDIKKDLYWCYEHRMDNLYKDNV